MHHFLHLTEAITRKLNGWKARTLSLAGKACLINFSLLPILFYSFAYCQVPRKLLSWVDAQIRAFIFHYGKRAGGQKVALHWLEHVHSSEGVGGCRHHQHLRMV